VRPRSEILLVDGKLLNGGARAQAWLDQQGPCSAAMPEAKAAAPAPFSMAVIAASNASCVGAALRE